jgi:hypothetical protein
VKNKEFQFLDKHVYPPMLGPLEETPAGSPDWAERLGLRLQLTIQRFEHFGVEELIPLLELALNTDPHPWKVWPKEQPAGTAEHYFRYAAGINCASLADLIHAYKPGHPLIDRLRRLADERIQPKPKQEIGKGKAGPGRGNKTGYTVPRLNDRGNAREHLLGQLKRDAPELADRVINGELTANAAAIQAGIRQRTIQHVPSVAGFLRAIGKHLDNQQRAELKNQL